MFFWVAMAQKKCYYIEVPIEAYDLVGVWRSLVAHLVWDQGAGGSNPLTPTILSVNSLLA